jgi:hypothetical protein
MLSGAGGRILCDYFNYSLPGLQNLSLHGCCIRDRDLDILAQGIEVNSSIHAIFLSKNLITDVGLIKLMTSISGNRKSSLTVLDLSSNLISLRRAATNVLDTFLHPQQDATLQLYLAHNFVLRKYESKHHYPFNKHKLEVRVHLTINGKSSRKLLAQASNYLVPHAESLLEHHHKHHHHHHHHHKHHHHHHRHQAGQTPQGAQTGLIKSEPTSPPSTTVDQHHQHPRQQLARDAIAGGRPISEPRMVPGEDPHYRRVSHTAPPPGAAGHHHPSLKPLALTPPVLTQVPKKIFIPISGAIPVMAAPSLLPLESGKQRTEVDDDDDSYSERISLPKEVGGRRREGSDESSGSDDESNENDDESDDDDDDDDASDSQYNGSMSQSQDTIESGSTQTNSVSVSTFQGSVAMASADGVNVEASPQDQSPQRVSQRMSRHLTSIRSAYGTQQPARTTIVAVRTSKAGANAATTPTSMNSPNFHTARQSTSSVSLPRIGKHGR